MSFNKIYWSISTFFQPTGDIIRDIDYEIGNFTGLGRHEQNINKEQVKDIVKLWETCRLFDPTPGRKFNAFPKFREFHNDLKPGKLNKWLSDQKIKMATSNPSFS